MTTATIRDGVTAPMGFQAGIATAGIKTPGRPDVALLVSATECTAAGVFTQNKVCAAPVEWCRARVPGTGVRAIVVNSGNANACTGEQGRADAAAMAACTADTLALRPEQVLVCSTGTIGIPMPMDRVENGIRTAASTLASELGAAAARAIMTTDTVPKEEVRELVIQNRTVRIGGMAKGAGMIEPNMATMLAFLTTDAAVEADSLQRLLRAVAERTFNRITVDGDQSTNDTALLLANGAAWHDAPPLAEGADGWDLFCAAVEAVAMGLAMRIVRDGEGATKLVTVTVTGAQDAVAAETVARSVARSLLFKTACYGEDPNWGRVIAAVGYAGAAVDPTRIALAFEHVVCVREGCRVEPFPQQALEAVMKQKEFEVRIDLGQGEAQYTVFTCDCSEEYVRINSEYTT